MDSHENLILNYWVATTKGLGYIKARKLEENVAPLKELFYDHALIKNSKIRLKEDTKDELIRRADERMLRSELNALYKNFPLYLFFSSFFSLQSKSPFQ